MNVLERAYLEAWYEFNLLMTQDEVLVSVYSILVTLSTGVVLDCEPICADLLNRF